MKRGLAAAVLVVLYLIGSAGAIHGQQRKLPTIGELWAATSAEAAPYREPFVARMRQLGWIDGKTAHFITRYYGADLAKGRAQAKELVALKVDVLMVTDAALPAARAVTTTIPMVCPDMFDPIAEGVSTSLARPSGNITGVSWQSIDTAAKRVEIAAELLPKMRRAILIYDATDPGATIESKGFEQGARNVKIPLEVFGVRGVGDLDAALARVRQTPPDVLFVSVNFFTIMQLSKIMNVANDLKVPTVSEIGLFAEAGALFSYGVDINETYARGADLVHRILKGAKPHQLPFEQPVKFDLIVNAKTAKTLGVKIPESIMLRAERVIR